MASETGSRSQPFGSLPFLPQRRLVPVIAVLLLFFAADSLGIFDGLNVRLYDAFFRARGMRPPSEKIVIVGIDDPSLRSLGRWPWDRGLYARLLDKLDTAGAVGIDLIFSEPSAGDERLGESIRKHRRVVLAAYFDNDLTRNLPAAALTAGRVGHVHVERDVDQISRSLFHTLSDPAGAVPSFSTAVYETFLERPWQRRDPLPDAAASRRSGRLFQTDYFKINYYGPPGTFRHVSFADVLDDRYPISFFAGKIVLVGATAVGLRDRSATPFSGTREEMPGVEIQANALNNLLDGTAMRDVPASVAWPMCLVVALLGLAIFIKTSERRAAWIWASGLVAVTAASYILFARFHLWLGPGIFYLTTAYVFLAAYLLKLDAAARQLDRKYASVAVHFASGEAPAARPGRRGLIGLFSRDGINGKIRGLLDIEESYEGNLEEAVRERTRKLAEAVSTIRQVSNELIFRLAKAVESRDESTGNHVARVALYSQIIARAMGRSREYVEAIAVTSSIHDIGKIGVPDHILLKKGALTIDEKAIMRTHTRIGYGILSASEHPRIREAAAIALTHHEHWDGSGYPAGLKGEEIPAEARIVALCDLYDALRSERTYKPGLDHETAVRYITEGGPNTSPGQFDSNVLRAFQQSAALFDEVFRRNRG
ncbi:MAG: CHASE2 domain-containing protein [Candidatus Aminicenantes bacterium]|nr:CHASE2 domain-containing protein [Candidatus Aminicenantes bacterium]